MTPTARRGAIRGALTLTAAALAGAAMRMLYKRPDRRAFLRQALNSAYWCGYAACLDDQGAPPSNGGRPTRRTAAPSKIVSINRARACS